MKKSVVLSLFLGAVAVLVGCETVEGYRQRVDQLVGRSSDSLQLEWGVPADRSTLTDASELWVFRKMTESTSGGYMSSRTSTRKETYVDKDGKTQTRTVTFQTPYYEPRVTTIKRCETRFVIKDNTIKSVGFEGDGCVAQLQSSSSSSSSSIGAMSGGAK